MRTFRQHEEINVTPLNQIPGVTAQGSITTTHTERVTQEFTTIRKGTITDRLLGRDQILQIPTATTQEKTNATTYRIAAVAQNQPENVIKLKNELLVYAGSGNLPLQLSPGQEQETDA